ncbi:MAG: S41 family peptidase [Bacillota bacterium]|nr:S41 family peptidase [Bacillota bacterium]
MNRRTFIKGIACGFFLPIALIMVMAVFNIGNIGDFFQSFYLLESKSIKSLDLSQKVEGAISGMIDELDDPYSYYLDQEEFSSLMEEVNGLYLGIGVYITEDEANEYTSIMSPIKGTPAFEAGLLAGDKILSINDESMKGRSASEVANTVKTAESDTITIEVEREGEALSFTIERQEITIPTVEGEFMAGEDGIAYISISQFNDMTPTDLNTTIADLQNSGEIKGIILDVRNNPGGSVPAVVEVAETFLPADDYIVWVLEKSSENSYRSENTNPLAVPIVMLINENSASASEILAAALQDNDVATMVGTNTFGKGIIQTVYSLRDGGAVKITTAQYLSPQKNVIHEVGVAPDIEEEADSTDPLAIYSKDVQEDNQLNAALTQLKKEMQ